MYEAASAGLAAQAPELAALTWEQFTSPDDWWLIPDDSGSPYKAELVLRQGIDRTVKVNLWNAPDRCGDAAPKPHSHPWAFTTHILTGGYGENRYTLAGDQVDAQLGVTHLGAASTPSPTATITKSPRSTSQAARSA